MLAESNVKTSKTLMVCVIDVQEGCSKLNCTVVVLEVKKC